MRKSQILWGFFGACLALSFLLATAGVFTFLWVFPLDAAGLPLWMLICALDVAIAISGFAAAPKARLFLWCTGLVLFTSRQGVPHVGLALVAGSALLWVLSRRRGPELVAVLAGTAAVLFLFGHDSRLLNPAMVERLENVRFSFHLVSAFALFRMLSWGISVRARGERPSFFDTMEYFLAPSFWLSPMHAAHLVFDHMQPAPASRTRLECAGWIARGFLHALFFTWLSTLAVPRLQERFAGGISSFSWWEWLLLGPLLFALAYLEKSRVSYLVAGCLSLSGRDVTPDFRSPWLARSLPEYWRRFHFWVWEFYVDFIYMPLSAMLRDWLSPRAASYWALFLTFSIGTSLIHWVHYPAPFTAALLLGCLFGLLTVLHGLAGPRFARSPLGIPLTWLSVFFLYGLAYPVYGLGWGLSELWLFLGK